jgi:hypothetical protein
MKTLNEWRVIYKEMRKEGSKITWQDVKLLYKAEVKANRKLEKQQYIDDALTYMERRDQERLEIYDRIYNI